MGSMPGSCPCRKQGAGGHAVMASPRGYGSPDGKGDRIEPAGRRACSGRASGAVARLGGVARNTRKQWGELFPCALMMKLSGVTRCLMFAHRLIEISSLVQPRC